MSKAQHYAETFGWAVFPLAPRSKKPFANSRGLKEATRDLEQIQAWRTRFANGQGQPNLGVATGHISGIVVIDIDPDSGGEQSWDALIDDYDNYPDTVEALTPRGGRHIYFQLPEGCIIRNDAGRKLGAGVDVRGDGGYVVAPPSIGPNGRGYEWEASSDPEDGIAPAPLPDWLRDLIEDKPEQRARYAERSTDGVIPEGQRDNYMTSLAGTMRRRGMSEKAIYAALESENERCDPPLDPKDLERIAHSVARYDPDQRAQAALQSPPDQCEDGHQGHSPEYWPSMPYIAFPHVNGKDMPLNTIQNLRAVMDAAGVQPRYNVISKEIELILPGAAHTLDNNKAASLARLKDLCEQCRMPTSKVDQYLVAIADMHAYNPVLDWVTQAPWDGESRWEALLDTVKCVDPVYEALKPTLLRRWMISALHAVSAPDGLAADGILVLQGPQHIGKTRWLSRLCPSQWFQEGAMINPQDKDSVKIAISHWIVELGELDATFRRADIAQLKAFLTKRRDELRLAYAAAASQFPRRTAFCASVNEKDFLKDPTGNRRFWTLACKDIDHEHDIDMQQVWAELHHYYQRGESHRITDDERERINEINLEHSARDPLEELVRTRLQWNTPPEVWSNWQTATDVLLKLGWRQPETKDTTRVGRVLQSLVPKEQQRISRGKTQYALPEWLHLDDGRF